LCAHGSHCPRFSLHPTSEQWLAVKTYPATTIYLRIGKVVNNNVAICSGHNHERVAYTHGIAPLWQLLCMSWVLLPCVPIPALLQKTVLSARNRTATKVSPVVIPKPNYALVHKMAKSFFTG
jgi:hypothetical protein